MLLAFETGVDGLSELFGDNGRSLFSAGFHPHIDDAEEWELAIVHPLKHAQELVFAGFRIMETFQGGRGASQKDGAFLKKAANHGQIARMVAGSVLLLVGVFVLFIDDDQAELFQGGKNGAARADDNARAAVVDLVPLVMPFAFGEMTVEHRHLLLHRRKPALEALDGLRSERDFRHQHDGALAAVEHALDALQIDLRLAAAGHAMEQQRLLGFVESEANLFKHSHLFGVERVGRRQDKRLPLVRVALDGFGFRDHQTLAHQRRERTAVGAGLFEQQGDWHGTGLPRIGRFVFCSLGHGAAQGFHDGRLLGSALLHFGEERVVDGPGQPCSQALLEGVPLADHLRQDGAHGRLDRAAVVFAHPTRQPEQVRPEDRALAHQLVQRAHPGHLRRVQDLDHRGERRPVPQMHRHPRADLHSRFEFRGNGVIERGAAGLVNEHACEFHR